jgi:sec-independent protein translocase protein TatB
MEILGVGISELVFIVIIALIVLGPKDMQKAGRTIGKWMRGIVTSEWWMTFINASREIRKIPAELMRDANEELRQIGKEANLASDLTSNLPAQPGTPPRSQPIPGSAAAKPPAEAGAPPPKTESQETESEQQSNA